MSNMNHSDFNWVDDADGLEADLNQNLRQLRRYERMIDDVLDEIEQGKPDRAAKLSTLIASMMKAKDQVIAERARLHDKERKQLGRLTEHDIDFDAVRSALGCRLVKLRACCRSKDVSG